MSFSLFKRFPVQVGLAALVAYTLTLSHGVTIYSVGLTSKIAGWDYQPITSQPLFWLFTLPVHILPAGWIPLALNLFSAVCAALTLGFLTASLELAGWDQPLATLAGWRARLPLVLGAVACGLEYNFWQAATQATGEALQILLLAIAIWCLFNFQAERRRQWLLLAAFVWGLGMIENWMMFITLPLFITTLIWQGKMRVLKLRLLVNLALAGLAGFSIIALLPIVNGLSPHSPNGVGESLWQTLQSTKSLMKNVSVGLWQGRRLAVVASVIYFLLPLVPALIRKRDEGTRNKGKMERYQIWFYRGLQVALLGVSLWLVFDPTMGLRQILREEFRLNLPLLSFDYLLGMSVAYLAGNLMLSMNAESRGRRRRTTLMQNLAGAVPLAMAMILAGVTLGLLLRNATAVTLVNRHPFKQFGQHVLSNLPTDGGVVLSDEPLRLLSLQAALAADGRKPNWLAVNTDLLNKPEYRQWLAQLGSCRWNAETNQGRLTPFQTLALLDRLTQSNRVYYLHPSFGYFFESFYLQPGALGQTLNKYSGRSVNPPALTAEAIARTEAFWDSVEPQMNALGKACAMARPNHSAGVTRFIDSRLHLKPVAPVQCQLLAGWYAMALDDWGVQLQRRGNLRAAQKRLAQAVELGDGNSVVSINFQVNTNLLAGHPLSLAGLKTMAAEFGDVRYLSRFLLAFGPVDEPAFCYLLGNNFIKLGLSRQALQQFERVSTLVPENPAPQLVLAELYAKTGFNPEARQAINSLRSKLPATFLATNAELSVNLAMVEAATWLRSSNLENARLVLRKTLAGFPDNALIAGQVLQAYVSFGDFTNALALVGRQIATDPDNPEKLLKKADILARMQDLSGALQILNHLLTLTNLPPAYFLRGIVHLKAGRLDQGEIDFLQVEKLSGRQVGVQLQLAEIALRRNDTNKAVGLLSGVLKDLPAGSTQRQLVAKKIEQLGERKW